MIIHKYGECLRYIYSHVSQDRCGFSCSQVPVVLTSVYTLQHGLAIISPAKQLSSYLQAQSHVDLTTPRATSFVSKTLYIFKMLFFLDFFTEVWKSFWTPSFWLPPNVTWNDFNDTETITYPKFHDICYPIGYSALVVIIRIIVER